MNQSILRYLFLVLIAGVVNNASFGQSIFTNPITGTNPNTSNPYTIGQILDAHITVSGIGRGTGIAGINTNDRYNATGWNSAALDANDYFEFTLAAKPEYKIDFTSFVYTGAASGTGPTNFAFRSSVDGYVANIGSPTAGGTTIDLSALTYQGITSAITFRIYGWGASSTMGTFSINDFTFNGVVTITTPKFYRSKNSGDWNSSSTWESSVDNVSWFAATLTPAAADKTITIQTGHAVTVSTSITLDETTIDGSLQVLTGGVLNINNGSGNDIDIQNNGVLQLLSTNTYTSTIIPGASVIHVSTGGKITIGDGIGSAGAGYEAFATSNVNVWDDGAIFEWNALSTFLMSGLTYFPNAGALIPIFKITNVSGNPTNGSLFTLNGMIEVNTNLILTGGGNKIFRNGIKGTATLTQNPGSGSFNITGTNAIIDGSSLNIVLSSPLNLSTSTIVPLGGNVTISGANISNSSGSMTVNGLLDVTTVQITNAAGTVTVNGTYKTAHMGGLSGTGSSIPSGTVTLNAGSTIEYNAFGYQAITTAGPAYYNITFSGSGNKTPNNTFTPLGTVTITGSATVDASTHNIGNGVAGTTNFTMDGGRLILGTTGTQPMMNGTYNLSGGVVQFNNSGVTAQTIRSPETYYAIEVTGTNVGNSLGNINLTSGGSFTIKSGGKFNINADQVTGSTGSQSVTVEAGGEFLCGNADGFSGGNGSAGFSTSIKSDIETISLASGSTINYMRSGNQIITNQLPYTNLTLSGTGNKTAPGAVLWILGDLTKSGTSTFVHNNGTVLFGGFASQTYSSTTPLTFYNVTNSNTSGLLVTSDMTIVRQLTLSANSKTNLTSGNVTLKSDATNTANVAEVPASVTITYGIGLFIVERYFSPKRAWRFLSVPTDNTQTIKAAWQEGAASTGDNFLPGYGTQVTDNIAGWATAGFDYYSPNGPSAKKFDAVNNVWTGISSTTIPIKTTEGIMTFIRGDRTANSLYAPTSPAILRTKGMLYVGTRPAITVNAGKFASVGNPYASALDMRKINLSGGVDSTFYIWDPKLTGSFGFGAYQTFKFIGNDFYPTPGFGSYGPPASPYNYIQSGQAFFVTASGSNGSVTITENAKASADSPAVNNTSVFRSIASQLQLLRTTLYGVNPDGTADVMDGVLNLFGDNYSNAIDEKDAIKVENFSENLAINKENKLLAVEASNMIGQKDTIVYNITKMKPTNYKFVITADNLDRPGITAFLEDSYLSISTPIDLSGGTSYNFNVTSDSGSRAPSRFRVVLKKVAAGPLPITFIFVKAYEQNTNIAVEWKIENEKNIKEYVVEKSFDGQRFSPTTTIDAKGNSSNALNYQWTDTDPINGNNYYRIRSVDMSGRVQYSNIVKITTGKNKPQIAVYPNPLVNNVINLQLINQPKGKYHLKLLDSDGRMLLTTQVQHGQGSSTQIIHINKLISKGTYLLEVTGAAKNKTIIKVSK